VDTRQQFQSALEHHRAGRLREAEAGYRQVLALETSNPDALNMLGVVANQLGRRTEAVSLLLRAIEIQPDRAGYYGNYGLVLASGLDWQLASDAFRKAIQIDPSMATAHNNLGNVLRELGQLTEAESELLTAIALQPDYADAFNNLGNVYQELQRLAEAIAAYERALAIRPTFVEARVALGSTLLLSGDYSRGWLEYEARWQAAGRSADRGFTQPLWDGANLNGKSILLHAEQGLGDTIQFIRYVPMIRQMGAGQVIVLCPPELNPLLAVQPGIDRVISDLSALPRFDVHCPLLSIPRMVGTRLENIPTESPYIFSDPAIFKSWKRRVSALPDASNIGIVWAGSASHANDQNRSMRLTDLAPLAQDRIRFFSVQKGEPAIQTRLPIPGMPLVDWTDELGNLAQTAGLIANLDLIISVDTAVAHLACAMGKFVWLMIPAAPDWRWMWNRADSPWYPTARLFRQPRRGDWRSVIHDVRNALVEFTKTGSASAPNPD
jgi:Tfp pilus assembly protein PilF